MNYLKRILIPTDFSKSARTALSYVAELIKPDPEIEILQLHVTSADEIREEVDNQLSTIFKEYHASIPNLRSMVKDGSLTEEILKVQQEMSVDLIIMGTEGSTQEESMAFTNTSSLVLEADCPVLVIPPQAKDFSMKNVALALGSEEIDDSYPLGVLFDITRSFDSKLHILTINHTGQPPSIDEINANILEYYFEKCDYHYVFPVDSDIEHGIAQYTKEREIDLLTILPRNHAKKSTPSEGRLTKLLAMHASVPLLTID